VLSTMTGRPLSTNELSQLFGYLADHEHYVFLDTSLPDAHNKKSLLFTHPVEILQYRVGENRNAFFRQLKDRSDAGYYLAGWFSYEFLQKKRSANLQTQLPVLAELGVYRDPVIFNHSTDESCFPFAENHSKEELSYLLQNLQPGMNREDYCQAIKAILEYIAAGDTYQVNYTFKFSFEFNGSVSRLYKDLRRSQPVPYGCWIRNGDRHILSFSPELFFRFNQKTITAKPMKGTMKRGRTNEEDLQYAHSLSQDQKNRSENVMIVDLLRNDLSRLIDSSGGGTVEVVSLFDVERYKSVLQMTSTIIADCKGENPLSPEDMLQAIFPCGSVTGAPKIRTMEIIEELEKQQRGVYTGAIGYFSPNQEAVFNVPIRTVVLDGSNGEMGIGSGIVADSSPEAEWQECLLKARFLTNPLPDFYLIETMFYTQANGYLFLNEHLDRLIASAEFYNIIYVRAEIEDELSCFKNSLKSGDCYRVRVTLSLESSVDINASICNPPTRLDLPDPLDDNEHDAVLIDFADMHQDSSDSWLFHKTSRREKYDSAYRKAQADGLYDVLFFNESEELTEGCITNIFILKDGSYFTPPLHCGLLNGVMRGQLLLRSSNSVPIKERVLFRKDLEGAEKIYLCNSVRGVVRAQLTEK